MVVARCGSINGSIKRVATIVVVMVVIALRRRRRALLCIRYKRVNDGHITFLPMKNEWCAMAISSCLLVVKLCDAAVRRRADAENAPKFTSEQVHTIG